MQNTTEEKDINEVFDDLLLCENKINQDGFEEGFKHALKTDHTEAYHLGYHRGAEVGAELGFYLGVVEHVNSTECYKEKYTEKVQKYIETLQNRIEKFPTDNSPNVDIAGELNNIRALYKKICAILHLDCTYSKESKLSF